MTDVPFAPPRDHESVETGTALTPRFDANGLLTAIAVDAESGEVLMVAHVDATALARTIETREAWFYSRSRRRLWKKGEDSGNVLHVTEIRIDCDQDAILLKVRVGGAGVACHRGYRSCFYRTIPLGVAAAPDIALAFDGGMPRETSPSAVAKESVER